MLWTDCRLVAFDTETTGLHPFDGDRIIEFGAIEFRLDAEGRVQDTQAHQMFVNPQMPIPRAASRVSGITDEDVAKAPTFDKLAKRISKVLQGSFLIAHNLSFDLNFLRVELERIGMYWPATQAEVDTLRLSQRLRGDLKSYKLEKLCKELGVPLDNAHRASHDAEACGRVFLELCKNHTAPSELEDLIAWADAISPPPDTGHLSFGKRGCVEFCFGEHRGESIIHHPDYLHWMTLALARQSGRWQPRFPESVRTWVQRWLRVRCAGRNRTSPRGQSHQDWTLDPRPWS